MKETTGFFQSIFRNIGRKLKTLAKIILVLGVLASVIYGIVMLTKSGEAADTYLVGDLLSGTYTGIGLFVMIGGSILSIITAFNMYGIGVIAEKCSCEETTVNTMSKVSNYEAHHKNSQTAFSNNSFQLDDSCPDMSDEKMKLIANLNQMFINGRISMQEFEKRYDDIVGKNDVECEKQKCPVCGAYLKDGAVFCTKCGSKVDKQ